MRIAATAKTPSLIQSILKALAIMVVPIIELAILRKYFHDVLQLRIGFPGFTDYELFLPAPMGFIAFILALETADTVKLKFQAPWFVLHLLILSTFIFLSRLASPFELWAIALIFTTVSAFFIFWNPKEFFTNPNFWAVGPSCLMVFSLVLYMKYGSHIWLFAIYKLEGVIRWIFEMTGNHTVKVSVLNEQLQLFHPLVRLRLGQGCGGFDGILFFLSAFSIFAPINWKWFRLRSWMSFALVGTLFFLVLNTLRILILFAVGITGALIWGQETGITLMVGVFHTHLGYLIYAGGIALYFATLTQIAERKSKSIQAGSSEPVFSKN